jgi:uncharacterized protein
MGKCGGVKRQGLPNARPNFQRVWNMPAMRGSFLSMDRNQLVAQLRDCADAIKAEGATALYVYGSRARGDNRPDSDLDVYVDYIPGSGFSLMNLAGIFNIISERTGLDVSITTHNSLHPKLKEAIEHESVQIF